MQNLLVLLCAALLMGSVVSDDTVTTSRIADGSVTSAKILDGGVAYADLSSALQDSLASYNGGGGGSADTLYYTIGVTAWSHNGTGVSNFGSSNFQAILFNDETGSSTSEYCYTTLSLPQAVGTRTNGIDVTLHVMSASNDPDDHNLTVGLLAFSSDEAAIEANYTKRTIACDVGTTNHRMVPTTDTFTGVLAAGDTQIAIKIEEATDADTPDNTRLSGVTLKIY